MAFFRNYKVLIYEQESHMTLLDLQAFIKTLEYQITDEKKHEKSSDGKWLKSLFAIGDIINYMRFGDGRAK